MANDTEPTESFIWSKPRKNISKFLKEYQLPQIARVVDGYPDKNEGTSITTEQIMVFHKIHSVQNLVGVDSLGRQVYIPLTCPLEALVCPLKCKYTECKVEELKTIFPKLQYIRVKSCGPSKDVSDNIFQRSLKVGDILQIQKIDKKKKTVVCQNVDNKRDVTLSYTSPAIFTPLLDSRKYTLSEVVTKYGLHSRVCFVSTRSQADKSTDQWNSALTRLAEVVFHKEVTEVKVIATVVGGGVDEQMYCIGLPTDLPICCTVAKGLTSKNGQSYEELVRTLDADFNSKHFTERVNVFQDKNAIKIYDLTSSESMATARQPQSGLVRSHAVKIPPKVSPKPKRRIKNSPNEHLPSDTKQPSQSTMTDVIHDKPTRNSLPEVATTTAAVYDRRTQSCPDDSATTDEEGYVEMNFFQKNNYEYINCEKGKHDSVDKQNNLAMYIPIKNPQLTCNVKATSSPEVREHLRNERSQQHDDQPENNTQYSQSYEEVKPKWNYSTSTEDFADPNLILRDNDKDSDYVIPLVSPNVKLETSKLVVFENDSDYVIPVISPSPKPQTRKFVIQKLTDAKNKPSNTGYENVEFANKKQIGQRRHAYENVVGWFKC